MTINELRNIINTLANQNSFGDISPDDFNTALHQAHEEYFSDKLDEFAKGQKENDDMNVLKERVSLNVGSYGVVSKPSNYAYGLAVRLATGANQKEVEVEILSDAEWANRSSSALISTDDYPIARIDNDGIQVAGVTDRIILYYLRKPVTPSWGYTSTAVPNSIYGRPTYDSATTVESDFQDSPTAMRTILYKVAQILAIPIQRQDLLQFSAAKEQS